MLQCTTRLYSSTNSVTCICTCMSWEKDPLLKVKTNTGHVGTCYTHHLCWYIQSLSAIQWGTGLKWPLQLLLESCTISLWKLQRCTLYKQFHCNRVECSPLFSTKFFIFIIQQSAIVSGRDITLVTSITTARATSDGVQLVTYSVLFCINT